MPVKLNSSGGGSVTLTTPSTASDFTVTVPAVTGSALVSTSGSSTSSTGIDFPSANTVSIKTNGTTAVTVDSSQNVGIGTASPVSASKLTVSGSLSVNSSDGNFSAGGVRAFMDYDAAGPAARIGALNGGTGTNPSVAFYTSNTERARIDSSGNLLVGTTSYQAKLTVFGTAVASTGVGSFWSTSASDVGNPAGSFVKYDNNTTTSQIFIKFGINQYSSGCGQINANGANTAAFGQFSDERLKENIVDLPSQLDNILALRPREFDYIESEGGGHQIGFVAQEIQKIYPDAVGERSDGMLTVTAWSKTEARLVKAIQELSAKLDAAEARIAALEGAK